MQTETKLKLWNFRSDEVLLLHIIIFFLLVIDALLFE